MPKPDPPDSRIEEVANPEHAPELADTLGNIDMFAALIGGLLFGVLGFVGDKVHLDPLWDMGLFGLITCWAVAAIFWFLFVARVAIGK